MTDPSPGPKMARFLDLMEKHMTLGQKQELFAELEARWVLWVTSHPGWKLRRGEGRILQLGPTGVHGRRARVINTGAIVMVRDLVHKDGGTHYAGTSCDWQLFINGVWASKGTEPEWLTCGEYWESLNELCRWGGRFRDSNHISLEHNGVQ